MRRRITGIAAMVLLAGCRAADEPLPPLRPGGTGTMGTTGTATGADSGSRAPGPPHGFVDVTAQAGVGYVQHVPVDTWSACIFADRPGFSDFPCDPERMAGGVAVADVDDDGWPDVYVTRLGARDLLFRNLGDGTFAEVGEQVGLTDVRNTNGAAFADLDGDGDLDLYVTTIDEGRYLLYVNQGGTFVEQGVVRGAAMESQAPLVGTSVVPADYDRDGDVDLFVGAWRPDDPGPEAAGAGLLENLGPGAEGTFDDVTLDAGIGLTDDDGGVYAFSAAVYDVDGDGRFDLNVIGDFRTSRLFLGRAGGGFQDVSIAWKAGKEKNGMGLAVGDIDGDLDPDFYATSIGKPPSPCGNCVTGTGNFLYRNDGDGLADVTDVYRVREGHWGWGAVLADFDGDGDLDLVYVHGMDVPSDFGPSLKAYADGGILYARAVDDGPPWVASAVGAGLLATGAFKAAATLDYDRDGDLDLFLTRNGADGPVLYRNDTSEDASFLVVDVRTAAGAPAFGAEVTLEVDGTDAARTFVGAQSGYLAQSQPVAHFGIPKGGTVTAVRVRYPTGELVEKTHLPPGPYLRVDP